MANIVSSAVIHETVSQILSGMVQKYEENGESNAYRNLERLEMAHIRLQAAVETSYKWHFTSASLVRWRRKLKCAAQECHDVLQKCKQRILEDEQGEKEVRSMPFPKRIAHATKSFIFSSFNHNDNSSGTSVVQRFEWYADGATEFLRFIELGGTPRHLMPFDTLIRHLFEGKKLQQKIIRGNECPLFLQWVPFSSTEYGIEANLSFIQKDSDTPEDNFYLGVSLQISESTDIIGVTVKCLQLFPPHLKSIAEIIRKNVIQLPTLDLSWVPFADSRQREYWDNLHSISSQWFRPDPLCCKQHGQQHKIHRTNNLNMEGCPDGSSLEPVIEVDLVCHVSCSNSSKKRTLLSEPKNSLHDPPYLQVGLIYMPHGSSDGMLPADKSSAITGISGEEKHWLHTDINLEELNKNMLPKVNDYFCHNIEAAIYQMIWRSKHGTAYIQFKKVSAEKPIARSTSQRSWKTELVQLQDQDLNFRRHMVAEFIESWGRQAPARLRGLIMNWVRKEMGNQLQHQQSNSILFETSR